MLVSIGACATAGGIQALRNFADVGGWVPLVYATPDWIHTLKTSTPISHHVKVDYELQGCPVDKHQLLEVVLAFISGRRPFLPSHARLHGLQAARRGVRDGGPRRGLPRPGHAHRLRGAVPVLRARLLRVLRPPARQRQHRLPERACSRATATPTRS